jgi:hypothetical protein
MFNLCGWDTAYTQPCPINIIAPVWLFISRCTAKDTSTHHWMMPVPSASNTCGLFLVSQRKCKHQPSFFQSSTSRGLSRKTQAFGDWDVFFSTSIAILLSSDGKKWQFCCPFFLHSHLSYTDDWTHWWMRPLSSGHSLSNSSV